MNTTKMLQGIATIEAQAETLVQMLEAVNNPTLADLSRMAHIQKEMQELLDYATEKMNIG